MLKGESHPATKLTDEQCREILRLSAVGIPQTVLARQFGVNKTTVWNIRRGKTRPHLQQQPLH
jgi:DNA-binding XRE family transcriptional regulator